MAEPEAIAFTLYSEPDDSFGKAYQGELQRIWKELQERGLQTSPSFD